MFRLSLGVNVEIGCRGGFFFDQIVEHIAVDIAVGADYLPGGLGVGDSEVVFFFYSSFPNLTV